MAQADTVAGTKLLIKISDGATPPVFTHLCTINGARSLSLTAATNDTNVPDCDDPDLMAWVEREKVSLSAQLSGAGVLHSPNFSDLYAYQISPDPRDVKIVIDVPAAKGGVVLSGKFLCTQIDIDGDRGQKANASLTLQSTGALTIAPNS